MRTLRFADLFCGIGGFHLGVTHAANKLGLDATCVWACDIDRWARAAYEANFGVQPLGDITDIDAETLGEHDLLCAGFPCQPFSVFGKMRGFEDTRGTLFFDIARILSAKKPRLFILENVKQLVSHRNGATLSVILDTLSTLGYETQYRVLNALDFGLPQKRERVFIVGWRRDRGGINFEWPTAIGERASLRSILETDVAEKYHASLQIQTSRQAARQGKEKSNGDTEPLIYHENKSGHISAYPFACALRAGSSHNYLLVNGARRLTERELLRLQGFPDSFTVTTSYSQTRRQTGNAVPAPLVAAVAKQLLAGAFARTIQEEIPERASIT